MKNIKYEIKRNSSEDSYYLPIFLHSNLDELGFMSGFDGNIGQIDEECNFTYSGTSKTITLYNTVNTTKFAMLVTVEYIIDWGDGTTNTLSMPQIGDLNLPSISHTYLTDGYYTIIVTLNSPWKVKYIKNEIKIPFTDTFGTISYFGTLVFTVPYTDPPQRVEQTYTEYYDPQIVPTEDTLVSFVGTGKSRVDELRKYGSSNEYDGIVIVSNITGYTLDNLYYFDYPDGTTMISGTTSSFEHEEVYNGMITRNEFFIGFVDEPVIYSDIFVDRGKLGVSEKNLRLSEIDSVGELDIYGNGYFTVRKQ